MKYLRKVNDTPNSIINEDNTYNTGIFKSYFKTLNFRDHPRKRFQNYLNNQLLTEWQAVEILGDDIFMIVAIYKFNLINKSLFLVYERETGNLIDFSSNTLFKHKAFVSKSLEKNCTSMRSTKSSLIEISNELEHGKIHIRGYATKKTQKVEFDISFNVISDPSIFVFPMTKNNIVYTEKDLLQPKGHISLNGITHEISPHNIAVLDDHRGYYPLSSGYDWLACMGYIDYNQKLRKFSLNLTSFYKNTDKEAYSENGYFLDGEFIHLKNVAFSRNGNTWKITDDNNSLDLTFTDLKHVTQIKKHIVKIDYLFAVGSISGTVTLCDGTKITINDMFALGEKRITQICNSKIN